MTGDVNATHECPGCGGPVLPGEDYVDAVEYVAEPGFTLHRMTADAVATADRRFHVGHFRHQIGSRLFVLRRPVDTGSTSWREGAD
jgi:hypothetical protein